MQLLGELAAAAKCQRMPLATNMCIIYNIHTYHAAIKPVSALHCNHQFMFAPAIPPPPLPHTSPSHSSLHQPPPPLKTIFAAAADGNCSLLESHMLPPPSPTQHNHINRNTNAHSTHISPTSNSSLLIALDTSCVISTDTCGRTALHWCADKRHTHASKLLVDANADVNSVDDLGNTPLHWAAVNGCEGVVRLLVDARSGVDAVNLR